MIITLKNNHNNNINSKSNTYNNKKIYKLNNFDYIGWF